MKNFTFIFLILEILGCSNNYVKGNQKLNFNACDSIIYKSIVAKKDISLVPKILDKYEFRITSKKTIVQFLFKFENQNDTFCLVEYRNVDSETCSVGEINQTFFADELELSTLDTSKLKALNCLLLKKGIIGYSKYKNFNTVEGYFGCSEE